MGRGCEAQAIPAGGECAGHGRPQSDSPSGRLAAAGLLQRPPHHGAAPSARPASRVSAGCRLFGGSGAQRAGNGTRRRSATAGIAERVTNALNSPAQARPKAMAQHRRQGRTATPRPLATPPPDALRRGPQPTLVYRSGAAPTRAPQDTERPGTASAAPMEQAGFPAAPAAPVTFPGSAMKVMHPMILQLVMQPSHGGCYQSQAIANAFRDLADLIAPRQQPVQIVMTAPPSTAVVNLAASSAWRPDELR